MVVDAAFWAGKKVLVTGHTGFKGSWLSLWLNQLGAIVYGYSLEPETQPNLYEVAKVNTLVQSRFTDINDAQMLRNHMAQIKPDIVFHLAAQALVRESYKNPANTVQTNVIGTVNLLEAVRHCGGVSAVVVVTSDKCYQNREWHWGYRENEALGGHDPYSASKACAELIVQSWRLSFMQVTTEGEPACALASARAGNVIGGGDWSKGRLIPDVLNSISNGRDVVLRYPNAIRPWQHVLEPLAGYLMLAQRLATEGQPWAQAWNFGPHDADARPVSWIVDSLIRMQDSKTSWVTQSNQDQVNTLAHEAQHLKLDCSKAHQLLGWQPAWTLADTLQEITSWHQAMARGENMQQVSLDTVNRYEKAMYTNNKSAQSTLRPHEP